MAICDMFVKNWKPNRCSLAISCVPNFYHYFTLENCGLWTALCLRELHSFLLIYLHRSASGLSYPTRRKSIIFLRSVRSFWIVDCLLYVEISTFDGNTSQLCFLFAQQIEVWKEQRMLNLLLSLSIRIKIIANALKLVIVHLLMKPEKNLMS